MSKFTSGQWDLDPLMGEIRANGSRIAKVYGALRSPKRTVLMRKFYERSRVHEAG